MQDILNQYCNEANKMRAVPSTSKFDQLSLLQGFNLTALQDEFLEGKKWKEMCSRNLKKLKISSMEENAIMMLLKYLADTKGKRIIETLTPKRYHYDHHMSIDPASRKSLELVQPLHKDSSMNKSYTLLNVINKTITSAGRRHLKADLCAPLTDIDGINERLDQVTFFYDRLTVTHIIRETLKLCGDVERLVQVFSANMAKFSHVIKLGQVLTSTQQLYQIMDQHLASDHSLRDLLNHLLAGSVHHKNLLNYLQKMISADDDETNFPAIGIDSECDGIRSEINILQEQVTRLKDNFTNTVKGGKLEIYKDFGYVYSVPKTNGESLQSIYNGINVMKVKTKSNRILFTDAKLQSINVELRINNAKLNQCRERFLQDLFKKINISIDWLKGIAQAIARLDVACSLAVVAKDGKYVRPTFEKQQSQLFQIIAGRHPIIESATFDSGSYIPNDCNLHPTDRVWLLTGPNMAGKSTYLRQNAIISIMAQIGSYVPADKAHLSIVDRLFTRIGSTDSVLQGRSTFMTEMLETAYFVSHATEKSLVILDEIGKQFNLNLFIELPDGQLKVNTFCNLLLMQVEELLRMMAWLSLGLLSNIYMIRLNADV